jgi:RNA polymerase primary sigma factor
MRDTLGDYLNAIGRHPLLTPAEEIHLARLVGAWVHHPDGPDSAPVSVQRKGRRARDRMVAANLRLVVSIARRSPRGLRYSDDQLLERIQNGTLGLIHSVSKFDPERGYKFSTYAYWWIQQQIMRGEQNADVIYLPANVRDDYRHLERAIEALHKEGKPITAAELSARTGLTEDRVRQRLEIGRVKVVASLDEAIPGTELSFGEHLSDPDADALADVERQQLQERLQQLIQQLPEREREVITEVQLGDGTLKSFAATHGISRSRAGQLRVKAVENLKQLANAA